MYDFPMKLNVAYTDGIISGFNLHRSGIGLYVPLKGLNRAQKKRLRRLDGTTVGYTGSSTMHFSDDYENDRKYWFKPSSFGIQYGRRQYWFIAFRDYYSGNLDVENVGKFVEEAHDFLDRVYP